MNKYCLHCGHQMHRTSQRTYCSDRCVKLVEGYNEWSKRKRDEALKSIKKALAPEHIIRKTKRENYLIISDSHVPYHHPDLIPFLKDFIGRYQIKPENMYHVGDLLDLYHYSSYLKDKNRKDNPTSELEAAREFIQQLAGVCPQLKVVLGNHESRLSKRAAEAELPSAVLRTIEDIFQFPKEWELKDEYLVFGSHSPFKVIHGEGFSGVSAHREAALINGVSTCMGHLHSHAGIAYVNTASQSLWGLNVGCSVDTGSYVFEYGNKHKFKSIVSIGAVCNGGEYPILEPI